MLDLQNPKKLRNLIDEEEAEMRRHIRAMKEQVESFHGPFWSAGSSLTDETYTPENAYFEYITAMLPRLAYSNPTVDAYTPRRGEAEDVAVGIEHGLNRLCEQQMIVRAARLQAMDMLFLFGCAVVTEEARTGTHLPPSHPRAGINLTWPVMTRVPQERLILDSCATELDGTRYRGHKTYWSKEDLIARAKKNPDEGWRLSQIEALTIESDTDEYLKSDTKPSLERNTVVVWEVYVPEIELDESPGPEHGFHGTVITLGVVNDPGKAAKSERRRGLIRKPRPFFGRPEGPYSIFRAYDVPNSPYPLSPLIACEGQIRDLNNQAIANTEAMQAYKKFLGVPSRAYAAQIQKDHGSVQVVPFDGAHALAAELEYGGVSDTQMAHLATAKERLDRVMGMDETLRGNVSGGATATEHSLAAESALARISEIQTAFQDSMTQVLRSYAFYLFHSNTIVFPLGSRVFDALEIRPPEGQVAEAFYEGGDVDQLEDGTSFDDLEIRLRPHSMARADEGRQAQRAMARHDLVLSSLPMMAQFPDFPWRQHFREIGEDINDDGLEDLVPQEMLQRLSEQIEMQMQVQTQPALDVPQARLSGMVGGQPTVNVSGSGGGSPSERIMRGRSGAAQGPSGQRPTQGSSQQPKGQQSGAQAAGAQT